MKTSILGAMILVMSTFAATAMADPPGSSASIELSPEVAACMNKCLAATSCVCSGGGAATVNDGRLADLQRQVNDLQEKLKPKKYTGPLPPDRVAILRKEFDALVLRVVVLEGKPDGASKADIDALRAQLDGLRSDVDALTRRVDLIEKDGAANTVDITLLKPRVDDHEKRIEKLELTPPSTRVVTFGARIGFVGLYAFGTGSNYTGMPIMGDLSFRLSPKVSIVTEAGIAISGDSSGVGTMLRAVLQYHVDDPKWSIDTGVSSVWAGYNSQLKAGYAAFLGDIGPTFKSGAFVLHASVLAGPSFEPRGTSFSLGGVVMLGVQLP